MNRLAGRGWLAALIVMSLFALAAPVALASYSWTDGVIRYSTITNCTSIILGSPYTESGAGAYVGAYVDPNNLPHAGETYYGHTVVAGVGNPCSGTYAHLEVAPPRSTGFAVSGSTPVYCYLGQLGQNTAPDTVDCPTAPTTGSYGGAAFNPTTRNDGLWPLPQGYFVEIQFPLSSSTSLNGIAHSPCDCLTGVTKILDGNGSPLLTPTEGIFVQPAVSTGGGGGSGGTTMPGSTGSMTGTSGMQSQTQTQSTGGTGSMGTQGMTQQNGTTQLTPGDSAATATGVTSPTKIGLAAAATKGVPVALSNAFDGSTDDITIQGTSGAVRSLREAKARTVKLGHLVKMGVHAGRVSYKVKVSKRAAKRVLGKRRSAAVQVLINVMAPGHSPTMLARKLTLKR